MAVGVRLTELAKGAGLPLGTLASLINRGKIPGVRLRGVPIRCSGLLLVAPERYHNGESRPIPVHCSARGKDPSHGALIVMNRRFPWHMGKTKR